MQTDQIQAITRPEVRLNWIKIFWWSTIHIGALLAPFTFTWSGLIVASLLYVAAGLGVTMGYHRLLTHRSFRTPRAVEYVLTLLGLLTNQGGPLRWAATHRAHHRHSDRDGDPHSPRDGRWWAHTLWWMPFDAVLDDPVRSRRYVLDLARDPVQCFFDRYHAVVPFILGVVLFAAGQMWAGVGLSWVVWGIFVRTALGYHATYFVNSAAHSWGYRSHATGDRSTNLWWVALLTFGEGWHNNHHAFPRSARHGLRWWELDLTYWGIRTLSLVGLANHIHVPGRILRQTSSPR